MSELEIRNLDVTLSRRQTEAWRALSKKTIRSLLYGGAKGGGKSWFLCVWAYMQAWAVGVRFGLKARAEVPHVGWIGRKQATDFVATTLQTWQDIIPGDYYRICGATDRHPRHIRIADRIAIDFGGLDRREDINKFNSAEYGFIAIDQAEETTKDEVSVLRASLRLKLEGQELDYKELYTANPAQVWLKTDFIDSVHPSRRFVQALPADNPHLPKSYVETLVEAFGHRPELLEAYLHGGWDQLEGAANVIKSAWLRRARTLIPVGSETVRHLVVVDPARFGDDETVVYYLKNTRIEDEKIFGHKPLTDCAGEVGEMANRHKINEHRPVIVCDEDGLGGGVIDNLRDWGFEVLGIQSASQADHPDRYYNKRAEMWWTVGLRYSRSEILEGVADERKQHLDAELDRQLTTVEYKWRNGKILVQDKEEIKKNLGRSPDRADAKIMGLYMIGRLPPIEAERHWLGQQRVDGRTLAESYVTRTVL